MLMSMLFGALRPAAQVSAQADSASSQGASPAEMLNPDGTLNLNEGFNGALDLSGYSVAIDPLRGPVFGAEGSAQPAAPTGQWAAVGDGGGVIDGTVRAIVVNGTDVYVGGNFTDAANIPEADYVAKWNGSAWSALSGNGSGNGTLNSSVESLAIIGTDLYVAGYFANINNNGTSLAAADYIAKWDGTNWSALGSNGAGNGSLGSFVYTIAASGTNLYVGGNFTNVNNNGTILTSADYIAKWDGTNWSALGSNGAGDGSLGGGVYIADLAVSGTNVYVGGNFLNVNNNGTVLTAADKVVKWDGANWSALGSNGAGDGAITSGTVYALAVSGSDLYVGGQFTGVNNNGTALPAANWVAKFDGANWSALGSNGAGGSSINNTVYSLFVNGTDVYVGGFFSNVNNNGTLLGAADYLAKWNGANWSALGSNGAGDGAITNKGGAFVMAIAMQSGSVLAGGGFYDLNNGGTVLPQADFLAAWDGANWSPLGLAANGALVNGYGSSAVNAILVNGTDVYVGGYFENVSNHGVNLTAADYIAKWDGTNWSALGSDGAGNGSLASDVAALAMIGTDLYVGGRFSNVNNNGIALPAADYIAKWDGTNWSALSSNGAGNGSLPNLGFVSALAVSGTNLYVGGNFTNVNNNGGLLLDADYIAKWDGANWSALGNNGVGDGALNSYVSALAVSGTDLYAGGGFTNAANNAPADYIAKWNGSAWSALGSDGAGNGSLNTSVNVLAANGSDLYVGGSFTNVNNGGAILGNADYLAKWNGSAWSALGNNISGSGSLKSSVRAIAISGSDVYVGGWFSNVNNDGLMVLAADYIAKWNGTSWSALGSDGAGNGSIKTNGGVNALAIQGTDLLVGGEFSNVNNNGTIIKEADYLAAYGITIDITPPAVGSITRLNLNPVNTASVDFAVTFSEPVMGVGTADFSLTAGGSVSGAAVSGVSGSGSTYTVTVSTGSGSGTLRLDVPVSAVVSDLAGNPLGGLPYTSGAVYSIRPATFGDVPTSYWAWQYIERLYNSGVTTGCGGGNYCPEGNVTRAQMAIFLLRGIHGAGYTPPLVGTSTGFADVATNYWAAAWIKQLGVEGITGGCGGGNYCPEGNVTRAQMAVFLLKAKHGKTFVPPAATGVFTDVPVGYWARDWIERLAVEAITSGCGGGNYCPEANVTRAQMAIFLVRTFNLP